MTTALAWSVRTADEARNALADAVALGARPEAIATSAEYADVAAMVRGCAPAIIDLADGALAVVRRRGEALEVLAPDGTRGCVAIADVVRALRTPAEATLGPELDALVALVAASAAAPARQAALRSALCATRLRGVPVGGVTLLRRAVHQPMRDHARDARLVARLAGLAALHLADYGLALGAWWAIGRTVLAGPLAAGWLAAWALLVATSLAARTAALAVAGPLAIDAAGVLRQRLHAGALRLAPDRVRAEGVGRSLGRVFEAQTVEGLAISGGFAALFTAIELVAVAFVLALGAGGALHVGILAAVLAATAIGIRGYVARRRAWSDERLAITHDLLDAMTGHATRLVQQRVRDRHAHEDPTLAGYAARSAALDRRAAWLQAAVPRGWLVLACGGLAPALLRGPVAIESLAVALGGVLLAYGALARLVDAATRLTDVAIGWRIVAPLVTAGGEAPLAGLTALAQATPSADQPLVLARGVGARTAPPFGRDVLADCDLVIRAGDRVLLEGASGSGKSTFASVLAGLRPPAGGLVLAGGLDRAALGERGWQQRVAFVPQLHDNHVFFGTLAFNLLMARAWPPRVEDLADAEAVCVELGLGPTLARMPAGLAQLVGETGWQLSHGERSRVFVARALLSAAPLVILDESLAALDPDTTIAVIACLERRARGLLVIAHP